MTVYSHYSIEPLDTAVYSYSYRCSPVHVCPQGPLFSVCCVLHTKLFTFLTSVQIVCVCLCKRHSSTRRGKKHQAHPCRAHKPKHHWSIGNQQLCQMLYVTVGSCRVGSCRGRPVHASTQGPLFGVYHVCACAHATAAPHPGKKGTRHTPAQQAGCLVQQHTHGCIHTTCVKRTRGSGGDGESVHM